MGAYVNHPTMDKIVWLKENGKQVSNVSSMTWGSFPSGQLPVFVLDNVIFTAAGIAFSEGEFNEFSRQKSRLHSVWLVDIRKLHDVSPELKDYAPYTTNC